MAETRVEADWTTRAGLRAVAVMTSMGHRCGYVEVPLGHPLHGAEYGEPTDAIVCDLKSVTMGRKSPVLAMTAGVGAAPGETIRRSPDVCFDVHGGITYSGGHGYPVESGGWWFGFDCAHSNDDYPGGPGRPLDYVTDECERLAAQIVEMVPTAQKKAPDRTQPAEG